MQVDSNEKVSDTNFKLAQGRSDHLTYKMQFAFIVPELPYNSSGYKLYWYNARLNKDGGVSAYTFWLKIEPNIQVSPISISPGTSVMVSGTGFPANGKLDLTFDGQNIGDKIITTSKGSFSTTYTVPTTIDGQHELKAAVPDIPDLESKVNLMLVSQATMSPNLPEVNNKASPGSVQLKTDAPMVVSTVRPAKETFGWFGPSIVTFSWTQPSDLRGVSYILEIGENLNFFPLAPGMQKTGLTTTSTMVNMNPGTYYWRVKAIDVDGNEGQWTISPYPFKVGIISITYVILGSILLILVILFVILAAFRRIRQYY